MRSKHPHTRSLLAVVLFVWLAHAVGCGGDDSELRHSTEAEQPAQAGEETMSQAELDRLRALGYVSEAEAHDETQALGLVLNIPGEVADGLLYYTNAFNCSSMLMRWDATVVHRWSHEPCYRWGNTVLLPDGDVLAVHRYPTDVKTPELEFKARRLLRVGWDGELIWERELPLHHDLDVLEDGRIAALTYRHEMIKDIDPNVSVRNHYISMLDPEGRLVEEASLADLLRSNPSVFSLQRIKPSMRDGFEELDLFHSNAIEWMHSAELARRDPIYATTNVLITVRHQDAVAIIDWSTKKLVWAWGQGVLSGPHDATLLSNGNILVFDNGLARGWSRVVEVNPQSREIVWEYAAPERKSFYTATRGAAHRMANGNTLITNSRWGGIFEVTREGKTVWAFLNPTIDETGRRSVIVRTRRLEGKTTATPKFPRTDSSGG